MRSSPPRFHRRQLERDGLLPRFRRVQEAAEDVRKIARILEESDAPEEVRAGAVPLRASADGHRRDRARGIPIVGRAGGGGASPGTDPVQALLRREARSERRP